MGSKHSETKYLLALILRRQREKNGLTIKKVMQMMGTTSPNAYTQYEKARPSPSIQANRAVSNQKEVSVPFMLYKTCVFIEEKR